MKLLFSFYFIFLQGKQLNRRISITFKKNLYLTAVYLFVSLGAFLYVCLLSVVVVAKMYVCIVYECCLNIKLRHRPYITNFHIDLQR